MPASEFLAELNDFVGCRVGLAVPDREFVEAIRELGAEQLAATPRDHIVRLRSSDYEDLSTRLLARYGDSIAAEGSNPIARAALRIWREDPSVAPVLRGFAELLLPSGNVFPDEDFPFALGFFVPIVSMYDSTVIPSGPSELDREAVIQEMRTSFGDQGATVASLMFRAKDAGDRLNPFRHLERYTAGSILDLGTLYTSRELVDGIFLDQRFIDFLAVNVAEVPRMHWRKFEGLCATYFARTGYDVEIGPGANDDGVDLRLWRPGEEGDHLTIVQCKRQEASIGKVVVKALWADVEAEGASRGVLATTARVSPGARQTIDARRYPIDVVERDAVRSWLAELRSPGSGLMLS